MKMLAVLLMLTCPAATVFAASGGQRGELGVGLTLGSPTGVSAKYWTGRATALDVLLGFGDLSIQADYLWHSWDAFSKPTAGRLAGYLGAGGRIKDTGDDTKAGVRGVGGIAYYFQGAPVELFGELAPVLNLAAHADVDLEAGVGVRYYFQSGPARAAPAGAPRR